MSDPVRREKHREANRRQYAKNPRAQIESRRRWLANNPSARVADRLRTKLRQAYNTGLTSTITALLGCSLEEFRSHIASKFRGGMTRFNHGTVWQFDHIKACALFDLTKLEHQKACFHFTNIQPLFKRENELKHTRAEAYSDNPIDSPLWREDREKAAREFCKMISSSVDQGHAHRQIDPPAQDHWQAGSETTIDSGQNHVRPQPPA